MSLIVVSKFHHITEEDKKVVIFSLEWQFTIGKWRISERDLQSREYFHRGVDRLLAYELKMTPRTSNSQGSSLSADGDVSYNQDPHLGHLRSPVNPSFSGCTVITPFDNR